ncbi:MAG: asparaginase domain-containing protein [Chloroflexota bacterium]
MDQSQTIKIFTTGGSIDKYYSTQESDFVVGPPVIDQVLQEANILLPYEVISLLKKDSLDITNEDRHHIYQAIAADPSERIIITHGTDTMIQTAQSLSSIPNKIIVLTGAMQPAAFKVTDAVFNIGCALMAVQVLPIGTHVIMNGQVFDPTQAKKNVAQDRFEQ